MKILSIDDAKQFAHQHPNQKVVIITGVTGQDGSFMVDYLLKNTPHIVFGGARRLSVSNHENIAHLEHEERFHLINFDLTDAHSISQTISQLQPDYFINFAAQSFVKSSWDFPAQTWDTNTTSLIHILESIRLHCPDCRFYNAGSSEEFGDVAYSPQDEKHPLRPRSPYGASKAAARQLVKVYRESYSLYAVQGWLFNHEGIRRGEEFVTRKITKAVAKIKKAIDYRTKSGLSGFDSLEPLELGNVDAKRDWSDAEDMVDAVWRMMNQENYREDMKNLPKGGILISPPKFIRSCLVPHLREYVVANGETHSIREFVELSFSHAGINGKWYMTDNDPLSERYVLTNSDGTTDGVSIVTINSAYYRPAEVEHLHGNAKQIVADLGWNPKTSFIELVKKMTLNDLK